MTAPAMSTTTEIDPAPAWGTSGESGVTGRFTWATCFSDSSKLVSTGMGGQTIAEGRLFRFSETGEPSQTFLRLVGAEDGDEETDLTADEADEFLLAAEQWIAELRVLRSQMGGQ